MYDVSKPALDTVTKKGGVACDSPAQVASKSDIIFTMLPNNDIVLEAYGGKNGVFETAKKGSLLVDSSTISPDTAKTVHSQAKQHNLEFIDAPVSGGKSKLYLLVTSFDNKS